MNWLKFIAVLLVIDAIVILIRPDYAKAAFNVLAQGSKIYLAAIIKAVLGIIFLFGATSKAALPWVIIIFGTLALAGAVFIVALPQKSRSMALWISSRGYFAIRLLGIIYLFIAVLLVYAA